ncbi:alpha-2-macroglobulin [Thiohalocapsa marina]|uniref:Alpha-2-macroglobulin n=1 Tax=Thiohalocapsa marina TaxID=424902 RepID=A0A5M8FNC2_9GAMM|nr:alpha-2-macroglobulin family protein [Thiohalocapsa marina]KAA6186287.1 alpha-2-macroglobulin [Thiohalocapsa marina]
MIPAKGLSRLFRLALVPALGLLVCSGWSCLSVAAPAGADPDAGADPGQRRLLIIEGADYFGRDYDTLRDVTLADCEQACLADSRCQAFTFNRNAGWCFLKSGYSALRAFDGAVSGRIVTGDAPDDAEQAALRRSELAFLPSSYRDEAADLRRRISSAGDGADGSFDRIVADARAAALAGDARRAAALYRVALRLAPEQSALWLRLADAAMALNSDDWRERGRLQQEATAAAVNGYLQAGTLRERAAALASIGRSLERRSAWRPAIRAERASLALLDDAELRAHLEALVAEHGFRVIGHDVSSDARDPRICVRFSDPLAREGVNLADFIQLDDPGLAVEPEAEQICIDGVRHGQRYGVTVRAGLPANDGERLARAVELDIYVRDRSPAVRFPGRAYVLPSGGEAALPMITVNTGRVAAELYRIGDRALGGFVANEELLQQLSQYQMDDIAERRGERLWRGEIEVRSALNQEITTAVPVAGLLGAADVNTEAGTESNRLGPGVYVLSAKPADSLNDSTLATQWFVVSDLGLTALQGSDGLHALTRSLSTAEPVPEVRLRLVALNQQVLGEAVADAQGYARFAPGLLRGEGGNAPALLVAEGADGDYGFLDLKGAPFDLSDRGVDGRPAPKPLDVYLVAERGIYRPGETVALTALVRDARARAVTDVPLTLVVQRPDGVEFLRQQVQDQGQGGRALAVTLLPDAMRGTWQARAYADPKGEVLAQTAFLVEDFLPERLDFDLHSSAERIDPADPPSIDLDARFLYGAPAANLAVEGGLRLEPADGLADWPGWRFGLADEDIAPRFEPIPGTETDDSGHARVGLVLPDMALPSRPLQAAIDIRVLDGGGRPVERALTLPLADRRPRIGIRPLFDGAVEEGGNAGFQVVALGPDGQPMALPGLRWTLSRVQTSYQWYQTDGDWRFQPIVSRQRVASGALDAIADLGASDANRIEARVDWGGYELLVSAGEAAADGALVPASVGFEAGWYVAPKAFDTPDVLKVSLDKAAYRVGETARVRLEPRFPGLALVMVVDEGLIAMQPVEVPEAGATLELPVTADWGPGAYVTAVLYRGMDLAARRMPRRAIGLHWAGVDPGPRQLDLRLDVVERSRPRGPLDVGLAIDNLAPGSEAYVSVAVVDNGILNLTRFEPWAPDAWYFGQRRLGMAIRDLYGRLIDRMQGEPGRIRSGGDASAMLQFDGPPPSEALVAFHSGVLRVDADGRARFPVDLPDFNGSLRVMAMAWSAEGVGHAHQDVLVRDPVVVSAALPRFLAPGDRSRMLLELAHVEGPAGAMQLSVQSSGGGLQIEGAGAPISVDVPEGGRAQVNLPIEATASGDQMLAIALTTPDGQTLTRQLRLGVRNLEPPVQVSSALVLAPGESLEINAERLTRDGFLPGTGSWLVSVTGAGAIDVPGLLQALDAYPYGCVEQVTSQALPLLYLDQAALDVGLGWMTAVGGDTDAASAKPIPQRIAEAIARVLANQSASGSFGLWGPGGGNLWLDAYVTDFLSRAREQGHAVPATAFDLALDGLRNQVGYAPDFQQGGEGIAYALYVLARNGRVAIGDLRWYQETRLDAFATPMARAQLGAALALYGERARAAIALRSALDLWLSQDDDQGWREDFGSHLRDGAALLTLAAETVPDAIDLADLARRLEAVSQQDPYASTQDQAWLLLAAHALMRGAAQPRLGIDGEPHAGPFFRRLDADDLAAAPLRLHNAGNRPVTALVTARGVPLQPPPAGGNGYVIERGYYDLDGRRVDPSQVAQGARLVVLLGIQGDVRQAARLIVNDPLPAGFEIDNPSLIAAGAVDGLPWLNVVDQPAHLAFRAERFVAALERSKDDPGRFQLAYVVRAVSPGQFAHPPATVEDMYRPERRARTDAGRVEITPITRQESQRGEHEDPRPRSGS